MKTYKKVLLICIGAAGLCAAAAVLIHKRCNSKRRKKEKAVTFEQIARSLNEDPDSIYYYDPEDESYIEFGPYGEDRKLKLVAQGEDMLADIEANCRIFVCEEDRERLMSELTREKLDEVIRTGKSYTVSFRLISDSAPVGCRLKVMRTEKPDNKHIVIGLRYDDCAPYEAPTKEPAPGSAMDPAGRDGLTGVKNKAAYQLEEQEINQSIDEGRCEPFALAVCDVNELKRYNDIYGLLAGDERLKDCCRIICDSFKHSPVFRIGGDEFVVLLRGTELDRKDELIKKLKEQMKLNREYSLPTVACGTAVYIEGRDRSVSSVFNRADAAMHRNKLFFNSPTPVD